MKYQVLDTTYDHIPLIVEGMSPAILGEIKITFPGMAPDEVLRSAFDQATEKFSFLADGDLVCIAGVTVSGLLSNKASPWLIPHSSNVNKYSRRFLVHGKKWVEYLSERYPVLENWVHAENPRAIEWLKWLGFTIGEPVSFNGHMFVPYRLERK